MFGMRNKSFNVKIVNDKLVGETEEETSNSVQNLLLAQGYAGLAKDVVTDITGTVVAAISAVVILKTAANVVNLLAGRLLR
jgi:hypothetical protein